MSNQVFDYIPELSRIDETKFVNECTNIVQSSNSRRDLLGYAQSLRLADYMGREIVPATRQETGDLLGLPREPRIRAEIKLQLRSGQRLVKNVRIAFCPFGRREAYAIEFDFPLQWLGYGPYSLSFFNPDPSHSGKGHFNAFFSELARYRVNQHRTLVFGDGGYEGNPRPVPLLVPKGSDSHNADVNPRWLDNLEEMVRTAKRYNVTVQVCLFYHHTIAGANFIDPPAPIRIAEIGNTPLNRYRNFYHVNSPWKPLQERIIRAVTRRLVGHWNVVYEVGNELRLPNARPGDAAYSNADLRNWVAWAADLLQRCSYGKLVTCSTGELSQNEAIINQIPQVRFGEFHRRQWDIDGDNDNVQAEMRAALDRAIGYGDQHHLLIDDDGDGKGENVPEEVGKWAFMALSMGGAQQGSFTHKGPYAPWSGVGFGSDGVKMLQALYKAWQGCFVIDGGGLPVPRPRPDLHVRI